MYGSAVWILWLHVWISSRQDLSRWFRCLLFAWGFSSHSSISLIWRRHHNRWLDANFELCSALMAIEQWVFLNVSRLLWQGASVYTCIVISEDPWHSDRMRSVWQWSCHYRLLRLKSVVAGIRTPNLPLAGWTL